MAIRSLMNTRNKKQFASPLLINSSRPICDDNRLEALKLAAEGIDTGYTIAQEAERHGLAPLVFHHLRKIDAAIDDPEFKKLRIQFVRNRHRNRILMKTLEKILIAFSNENIEVLVLKGGALCNLIYSDTALRPMGDLDVLVKKGDAQIACDTLYDMGFVSRQRKSKHHLLHAMPEMIKQVDGMSVNVDLHKNVFTNLHPVSLTLENVGNPLLSFEVGSQRAFTLGYTQMLLHLCHHLITPGQAIKLISVADIIGFVTHYADEINWQQLRESYPFVINTLCMLDLLAPLSDEIRQKAGLKKSKVTNDIGIEYTGWPNTSFLSAKQKENGYRTLFHDSICAPEWWLRLHYGYEKKYPI